MLLRLEKSSCVTVQVDGTSERPAMVNKACTPPSAFPFEFLMKRASRTGPLAVMNEGNVFLEFANNACGLERGLVPPTVGSAWHDLQESLLNFGPRPLTATSSTSEKRSSPSSKS